MTQFVQKDAGGSVSYEVTHTAPTRWDADPTPTVTIYSKGGAELVASQSATEGPSTTISATASAGGTSLTVTAATSIEYGDILCLGPNAAGQWEWITVDGINSSTKALTTRDDLRHSYASATVLKSHKLSVDLTAAEADGIYPYCRAEWLYEISDVEKTETSMFHISKWAPRMTLRDADILIRMPRAEDLLGGRQRLSQVIQDVWERDVLADLAVKVDPGGLVSGDDLRQVHLYRVLMELASHAGLSEDQARWADQHQDAWQRVYQTSLIDVDGSGTIDDDDIVMPYQIGRIIRS